MTSEMSDVLLLSLFYWGLSVVMLRFVVNMRSNTFYLLSSTYAFLSVVAGWKINMKWTLAASLLFMVMAMSITLWVIFKQSRECMRDLKQLREEEGKATTHEEPHNGK